MTQSNFDRALFSTSGTLPAGFALQGSFGRWTLTTPDGRTLGPFEQRRFALNAALRDQAGR